MNHNSSYGLMEMIRAHVQVPALGKILIVCKPGDANYDKLSRLATPDITGDANQVRLYSTLETAYAAAVTNENDVIVLDGQSTHVVANGIAWTKSRIHVIGFDGGDRLVQQGAKVQSTDEAGDAYVIKVTGVRNSFHNIKFIQVDTDAAALTVAQLGGEGNLYKNCSFTFGVADNLGSASAFEVVNGEDSGTFIDCQFGADTLLTTEARAVMSVDIVTSGQEFKSNRFRGCTFLISSSSATAAFIRLAAVTDILFANVFDDCNFVASVDSAGGIAVAEAVQTGTGTNKGTLNFGYPRAFNVTNFTTATSGRNAGVQIVAPLSVSTDVVGITPIAT